MLKGIPIEVLLAKKSNKYIFCLSIIGVREVPILANFFEILTGLCIKGIS
jgi:hypothetical protein